MSRRAAMIRLVAGFVVAVAVWRLSDLVVPPGYTHGTHAARAALALAGTLLGWGVVSRLTGPPRAPDGIDLRWFALGAVSYLVPTAVAGAAVLVLGLARVSPNLAPGAMLGQGLVLLLLVLAFEAIPEELLFRDLLYTSLRRLAGAAVAVVGQAVLFVLWGALTGSSLTLDRLVVFFLFSIALGILRHLSGHVATTMGFHAAFQLSAQWLLGTNWDGWAVTDDQLWLAGALFVPPLLLAPGIVRLASRPRVRIGQARPSAA